MTMETNTSTNPAIDRIDRELREQFGAEVRTIEQAAERRTTQRAGLLRPDGQPKYAPAEHAERLSAIDSEFEVVAARITEVAAIAVEAVRRDLALLDGASAYDALTTAEQETVARRMELIREDVDRQRPDQLVAVARAALAKNDRALLYLLDRYIPARLEREGRQRDPELLAVALELTERLVDPQAKAKREKAARKLSSAQVLGGHVARVRRGGLEGLMREMRSSGRYGRL